MHRTGARPEGHTAFCSPQTLSLLKQPALPCDKDPWKIKCCMTVMERDFHDPSSVCTYMQTPCSVLLSMCQGKRSATPQPTQDSKDLDLSLHSRAELQGEETSSLLCHQDAGSGHTVRLPIRGTREDQRAGAGTEGTAG